MSGAASGASTSRGATRAGHFTVAWQTADTRALVGKRSRSTFKREEVRWEGRCVGGGGGAPACPAA